MSQAQQGDWVQIYRVILPVGERAPQVPKETASVPLEMWVKGFLVETFITGTIGSCKTVL